VLALLKDYIVFAEKDEELSKYILWQHQTGAINIKNFLKGRERIWGITSGKKYN
jgi:hypothetical protein